MLNDFPNLQAVLDGRVSGRHTEWPMVRVELGRLLNLLDGWSGHAWKDGTYIDDLQEFFDAAVGREQ